MIKEVYKRLGIEPDLETEKRKFRNRLKSILREFSHDFEYDEHSEFYLKLSRVLGEYSVESKFEYYLVNDGNVDYQCEKSLEVSQVLLNLLKEDYPDSYTFLKNRIEEVLPYSAVDLGIIFKNGMFIKSGAETLDRVAIIEPLDWLGNYPTTKSYFESALGYYLNKRYGDAMTNAYSALESLVKTVLEKNRTLDNLIGDLITHLSLESGWGSILAQFCRIAHEFSTRHGEREGENTEKDIDPKYAEAYIYFTGLMIRLIIRTVEEKE